MSIVKGQGFTAWLASEPLRNMLRFAQGQFLLYSLDPAFDVKCFSSKRSTWKGC